MSFGAVHLAFPVGTKPRAKADHPCSPALRDLRLVGSKPMSKPNSLRQATGYSGEGEQKLDCSRKQVIHIIA